MDDRTLLTQYAQDGSADAFARLAGRYVDLVWSAAARQVGRPDLAEDVTQAVFIALSRRALSGALQKPGIVLSAWLLTATRYASIDALKRESRRSRHERRAATMRSEIQLSADQTDSSQSDWEDVRPVLDAAMLALPEKDRRAVALRYFEGRSFEEVGAAMGATREAAKQRVFRAIERLRTKLLGKGVTVSVAALGTMIGANAVHAAPPALAGACGAVALSAATASASAAARQIANALLNAMTWVKTKIVASALAGAFALGGSAAAVTAVAVRASAPTTPVNPPTREAPVIPILAQAAPAAAEEVDWRPAFEKAYGLADGQTVRLVPPPLIKERWNWWKTQQPHVLPPEPGKPMFEKIFVIAFSHGQFKWEMAGVNDGDPRTALSAIAALRGYEIVGPHAILRAEIPGDWVYRKQSTLIDRVAGIEAIVRERLKTAVTIEPVTKKMDVVVVRGQLQLKTPLDDRGRPVVEVGLGEKIEPAPGAPSAFGHPSAAALRDVFREAEDLLNLRFDDETDWGRTRIVLKRFIGPEKSKAEERKRLLARLMEQTGLELTVEQREVDVWEVAEEK